jgi:hypothetical protein
MLFRSLTALLNRFDSVTLTNALQQRPDKYPTVINALAKLTREIVGLERFRSVQQEQAKREAERNPENLGRIRTETVQKMLHALRVHWDQEGGYQRGQHPLRWRY